MKRLTPLKAEKEDWHSSVYHPGQFEIDQDYKRLKHEMIKEAKYTCESCRQRFRVMDLGLHHILPRLKGGETTWDNCIVLCNECHNKIEDLDLRYKSQIRHLYAKNPHPLKQPIKSGATNWHQWVYGGQRNPQLDID